jgi:hypothetical protein
VPDIVLNATLIIFFSFSTSAKCYYDHFIDVETRTYSNEENLAEREEERRGGGLIQQ